MEDLKWHYLITYDSIDLDEQADLSSDDDVVLGKALTDQHIWGSFKSPLKIEEKPREFEPGCSQW